MQTNSMYQQLFLVAQFYAPTEMYWSRLMLQKLPNWVLIKDSITLKGMSTTYLVDDTKEQHWLPACRRRLASSDLQEHGSNQYGNNDCLNNLWDP